MLKTTENELRLDYNSLQIKQKLGQTKMILSPKMVSMFGDTDTCEFSND